MHVKSMYRLSRVLAAAVLAVGAWSHAPAQTSGFAERELSFQNGSVELRGTLMLSATQRPSPAVVFLHGSGPHPLARRSIYRELA